MVLVLAAGLARLRLDEWARHSAETAIADALDAETSIDAVRVSLLGLRVEAEGVRIRHRGGAFDIEVPLIEIEQGWSGVPLPPFRRIDLGSVRIVRPVVRVDDDRLPPGGGTDGDTRAIELRIGRLELEGGRFDYRAASIPLDLAATDLAVQGAWGGLARAMTGHATFALALETPPFERPLAVDVDTAFRWRGGRIDAGRLRVAGSGLSVDGRAELDLGRGTALLGGGRFTADLQAFGALLDDSVPPLAGRADGTFEVTYGTGLPVRVEGDAHVLDGALGDIRAAEARGRVVYERNEVRITDLDAEAWGGAVAGTVTLGLGGSTTIDVRATGRGLSAPLLLEWLDLPLPFSARVDTEVSLAGPVDDPGVWDGEGTVRLAPAPGTGGRLPFGGEGRFELRRGRLTAAVPVARVAGARFDLALDVPLGAPERGRLVLDGSTADAAATLAGTRTVLRALGIEDGGLLAEPLHGRGPLRAEVPFDGDLDLVLDLADGSWAGEPFDRARLDLALRGSTAVVRGLEWEREDDRLEGALTVDLDSGAVVEARVHAERVRIGGLLARFAADVDLDGVVSGDLDLATVDGTLAGGGRIVADELVLSNEPLGRLEAVIEVDGARIRSAGARLSGAAIEGSADLVVDVAAGTGAATLETALVRLEDLRTFREAEVPLTGTLGLTGAFGWSPAGPEGEIRLVADDIAAQEQPLGALEGWFAPDASGVLFEIGSAGERTWTVAGRVTFEDGRMPIDAAIELDGLRIDRVEGMPESVWLRLTGSARMSGEVGDIAALDVDGELDRAELQVGVRRLTTSTPTPVWVRLGRLTAGPLQVTGPESELTASVAVDLGDGSLEAAAEGRLALALASALRPELRASGLAEIDARVTGSLSDPDVQGSLAVRNGRARWLGFPDTLEQIDLEFALRGDRAELERFTAVVSGGEIRATGAAELDALPVGDFGFDFDLSNVRVRYPDGFEGVYEGRLRLAGDGRNAALTGALVMLRGVYDDEFDLFGVGPTREYGADDVADLPDLTLDVDISAGGNVWVRNETARVELVFGLAIEGTLERPEVTGRINMVEGGTIDFRDVEYRIESGSLDLTDPGRIDPFVTLRAETAVQNYEITLRVEGTIEHLDYELTSNPSLSQQDIIALLATGRTLDDGGGAPGDFTGDLAANYFAGALTGRFQKQLERVLPVDRVRIDPLLIEAGKTDPTTRITVGKEVADDLFVIISQDVGATERQLYEVEWQASRRVRLSAQRDTTGGLGADIRYTDRYWWFKRQQVAEDAPRPALPGDVASAEDAGSGERIAAIEVVGLDDDEERAVRRRLPIEVGQPFRRYRLFAGTEAIRRYFVETGRIHVDVDAEATPLDEPTAMRLVYRVTPGRRTDIVFEGAPKKERKLLRDRLETLWAESLFVESLYRDAEEEIRSFYVSRGFYTVDVEAERAAVDGTERLVFHIDRGEPVRVSEVTVVGALRVEEERIRRQLLTRPGSLFARQLLDPGRLRDDVAAVRNLYRDLGFLAVRIDDPEIRVSADGDAARVILTIHEGERFTIEDVDVEGEVPVETRRVVEWSGLTAGEVYSRSALLAAESEVRARIDELGYPDATVRGRAEVTGSAVRIRLQIDTGSPRRVGSIEIEGNLLTDDPVIRRELEFGPGDALSRRTLLDSQRRLYRLGIFRNVRIGYEPLDPDDPVTQRVTVRVEESRPLGMAVGLGWDSEAKLRASLGLTNDNLFGRDLTTRIEGVTSSILRRASVTVESPRLLGARLPTLVNFGWEDREEVGYTSETKSTAVRVERRLAPTWRGFVGYTFQRVNLRDVVDELAVEEEKLENIRLGDVGITFARDTRDDILLPTRGMHVLLGVRVFADPFLSDSEFLKLSAGYSQVATFDNGTALAWAIRAGAEPTYGSTAEVPLSERFFAGGDSTLRGFSRDAVGPRTANGFPTGGEGLFLVNQEFRFPIWSSLKGVVFYDGGNIYRRLEDFDPTELRHVLGTGLRFETPIGPLRLEYGRKLDREPGESQGELFLAIGSPF